MNRKLLIFGAGLCGMSAREITKHRGCFEKVNFLDDNTLVPAGTEIKSGEIFKRNKIEADDLFFDTEKSPGNADSVKNLHGLLPVHGLEYCFEDGM